MDKGTLVDLTELTPEVFPLFSICPYPPIKNWDVTEFDNDKLGKAVQIWKAIISKNEPKTSEDVKKIYKESTFDQTEIIHDVVFEYMNGLKTVKQSIMEIGKEEPVSPDIGEKLYIFLSTEIVSNFRRLSHVFCSF